MLFEKSPQNHYPKAIEAKIIAKGLVVMELGIEEQEPNIMELSIIARPDTTEWAVSFLTAMALRMAFKIVTTNMLESKVCSKIAAAQT